MSNVKEMNIRACPQCGSLRLSWLGRSAADSAVIGIGALTGLYKCSNCAYEGLPVVFKTMRKYTEFAAYLKKKKPVRTAQAPARGPAPPYSSRWVVTQFKMEAAIALLLLLLFLALFFLRG